MKLNRLFALTIFALLLLAPLAVAQQLDIETVSGRETAAREVLIKLRPGTTVQQLSQTFDAEMTQPVGDSGVIRLKSRSLDAATLIEQTNRSPLVEWAEPNFVIRAVDNPPNDTKFLAGDLWGLNNTAQAILGKVGLPFADIEALKAWDITQGAATVLVGVLDTGVDYTHPDLAANIWTAAAPFTLTFGSQSITCPVGSHGFNALAFSCDPRDDHLHGTFVSGVIGAKGNNGLGVTGVNWTTSIVSFKFLNAFGYGTVADAANTIEAAVQMNVAGLNLRILNISWGSAASSTALQTAIAHANARGMLIVAGAGNNTQDNDGPISFYPASYAAPNIIAVAATDNQDKLASFSNYGLTTVDLGAPGVDIESTIPGAGYDYYSGTSLATAYVSGTAALILAKCGSALPLTDLRDAILNSVDAVPSLVGKTVKGGRLNAYRALTQCIALDFALSATPESISVTAGASVSSTIKASTVTGFAGAIALSVSGLPAGVTANFSSLSVTLPGPGTSTLTFLTTSAALAGTYPITVTGTGPGGTVTYTVGLSLIVHTPDFSLTPSPVSVSVNPGSSSTSAISVAALYGFSGTVGLSAAGLPAGVTASFLPASMILPGDSALTLTATAAAVPGIYTFTVTGVSGALTHTVTLNLLVTTPDFTMSSSPGTVMLAAGGVANSQITVSALNGFNGIVNLTASGMPAGVVASLTPSSMTGGGNSALALTVAASTVGGIYPITVKGTSGALVRTTTVNLSVIAPLLITTASLPVGQVGVFYSQPLAATGGVMPYSWAIISGRLPRGLDLNPSTGVISGTLTSLLNASFTFQVTDSTTPIANTQTVTLGLTFTNPGFAITTPSLPNGQIGTFYSQALTTTGGIGPYSWSIIAGGPLPGPLGLNPTTGVISGTPTGVSNSTLTIQVIDSNVPAQTATKILTLAITLPGVAITTTSLAAGQVGIPYSQTLAATGGTTPYSWKIISGRLSPGLNFDEATGQISGIPTAVNSGSSLIFRVTDSTLPVAQTATVNLLLTIKP